MKISIPKPQNSRALSLKEQQHFPILRVLDFKEWRPLSRSINVSAFSDNLSLLEQRELLLKFSQYLATLLKREIQNAIDSQRFPHKYAPLSPHYSSYKKNTGLRSGFWRATNFLNSNLTVYLDLLSTSTFIIGFPKDLKHPKSKFPLYLIALANEFGVPEKNLPARPLFLPKAQQLSKNISYIFEQFLKEHHFNYYLTLLK